MITEYTKVPCFDINGKSYAECVVCKKSNRICCSGSYGWGQNGSYVYEPKCLDCCDHIVRGRKIINIPFHKIKSV